MPTESILGQLHAWPVAHVALGATLGGSCFLQCGSQGQCALLVAVVRGASASVGRMPHEDCGPRLREQPESTLELAGTLAGLQCKPSITEAKQLLRSIGVAIAASKLGKLSKGELAGPSGCLS